MAGGLSKIIKDTDSCVLFVLALDRVRAEFDAETELRVQRKEEMVYGEERRGFRARFNDMFYGMRVRFTKGEPTDLNGII